MAKSGVFVFRGINAINLDPKGRMAMPTRYRDRLLADGANQMIVTIDTEAPCLLLYPMAEWEIIEQKIEALSSFNKVTRRIQRLLIGHATEVELDSSGRMLLPAVLREYASLDKRIMLVGQGKKFEIWDEQQWQQGRDTWLAEASAQTEAMPLELQSLAL